ncbi:MAG: cysteine--tRNA ligase [Candidatus Margulisiibacteriota bacterium]|jgi:cysteinyl-tRNA synthetase
MIKLYLYNTLAHQKQNFVPLQNQQVGLYTCGPTVYNFAHIGNLRTYLFEDILKRTLTYFEFQVKHVMNITDVGHLTDDADNGDDKMEKAAILEQKNAWEIADFYTQSFKKDLASLNIQEPNIWCKATDHIKEQIEAIQKIEANGFIYRTDDGIYFDTSKLPDYGELARLDIKGLQAGHRIDLGQKKNPTDFALWKFSKPLEKRQMEWSSPWGKGFPGWHIECSAMSAHYLGLPFDIHCGGIDHIPVHHANEIAQTKAAENKSLANYWLHGEFLIINEARMGKSANNFITLQSLAEKQILPLAYRYFVLGTHYRQKLNFSWEGLQQAQQALFNLYEQIENLPEATKPLPDFVNSFNQIIADDLNTPQVLALLWNLVKSSAQPAEKAATIYLFDEILGLKLKATTLYLQKKNSTVPSEIILLLKDRQIARQNKNWDLSDQLRKKIENYGYRITDQSTEQILLKIPTYSDLA